MSNTKRLVQSAVLIALALALSYTERFIPLQLLIPLPGVKLGLANVVTLIALYLLGGKTAFTAYVLGNGTGSHPAAKALNDASALLSEIGISLDVKDVADASIIWNAVSEGTHEIWAGAWDESLISVYSADSYYGINDNAIAERASEASTVSEYKELYDSLFSEWAVDIPCYRRQSCTVFSSLRVDMTSLPEAMTEYYGWDNEIEKITMK